MNAEQRGGMALNKDFRSKTGNGSVSREGRAIATPTGEGCTHIPPSLPPSSIFIYFILALLFSLSLRKLCLFCSSPLPCPPSLSLPLQPGCPNIALIPKLCLPIPGPTRQRINGRPQDQPEAGAELQSEREREREPESRCVRSSLRPHAASSTSEAPRCTAGREHTNQLSSPII